MRLLRPVRSFLVTVVAGGVALAAGLALLQPGVLTLARSHYFTSPAVGELRNLSQRSTIYDAAGNELGRLGLENRESVPLEQVPDVLRNAVIATEDATFWTNDGIDIGAVVRAALKNITSGKIEQGGSTITQQLVKNRILSPKRDINRKVREILLALRLDKTFTKQEILEQYLNTVYFGQGSYGVKSAAERFFTIQDPKNGVTRGKQLSELTISDAALLAGVIANPEGDNPFLHPESARARRTFVLGRMFEQGYITAAERDAAEEHPIPSQKPDAELRPRSSWVEEVQDRLFHDPRYTFLGLTPTERQNRVLRGGLKIYTTLDPGMQAAAADAVTENLPGKEGFTSSLVAIDPATGAVRAMVAGPGFEQSQYNIATSYPGRQVGSTWKVMTLATAIANGFSPADLVDGSSPCEFGALGKTQNSEGANEGFTTLRGATVGSVNCAYVRTELALGFSKIIAMARRMGIEQNTLQPILTLTLGSIEATPLEMATVDATIASGGIHRTPYFVQKVVGPDGDTLFDALPLGDRVLDPDTAACMTDLMKGVVTGGTGTNARLPGRDAAGKTGTTDRQADAWFLGFTPQLAAVVWHGNITGQVSGAGFGGNIPARTWRSFMTRVLEGQPVVPLPAAGPKCSTPGALISEAGRQVPPAGFELDGAGKVVTPTTLPPQVTVEPLPTTTTTKKPPATAGP